MPQNKTVATDASVADFVEAVENDTRRADAHTILTLMQRVTRMEPRMWGPSMIGFGSCHYRYETGREGDMFRLGFSPRKSNLVLYLDVSAAESQALLARLGKYKTSVACLYINRLSDVDAAVLEQLVSVSWESSRAKYGEPA